MNDEDQNAADNAGTADELRPESSGTGLGVVLGVGQASIRSATGKVDSGAGSSNEEITQIMAAAALAFKNVQFGQAGQHYERARLLFEQLGIKDGAQYRDCLRNLCDVYTVLDKPKQALKIITALRKVDDSPANKTNHLSILLHLGNRLEADEKRYEDAETMYRSAVDLAKQWLPCTDPMIERLNKAAIQAHKKVVATGGYEPDDSDGLLASAAGLSGALGRRHTGTHKILRSSLIAVPTQPMQQTSQGSDDGAPADESVSLGSPVGARSDRGDDKLPVVPPFQLLLMVTSMILLVCFIVLGLWQIERSVSGTLRERSQPSVSGVALHPAK